ncbi:uncharacterized protein PAC_04645 [Phialocephala subalpina]|uniref:Uncharacterized protein n=1 Tax=Phialocephala subalpina TaxID=576137 RepID=A0A1L7WPU7_9HELO|nr:uncharacterized protein PAC_04645 [Phialocephala subalpina]
MGWSDPQATTRVVFSGLTTTASHLTMYDSWYLNRFDDYCDTFSKDYEILGIGRETAELDLDPPKKLDADDVLGWLGEGHDLCSHGRFRILFTRHRSHQHHELKPWYMAFQKNEFKRISNAMNLPSDYLFLRRGTGGCGAFMKHTTTSEDGLVSHLAFTIRVPHSPRINAKAIWSLTSSWNASQCSTSTLFESLSDEDVQEVFEYLTAKKSYLIHPLTLPAMLADLLTAFYIDHRRQFQGSLYVLEHQLGITRGERETDAWDWNFDLHRESTKHCHRIQTSLTYLERQLQFAIGLCHFVLACLKDCDDEAIFPEQHRAKLRVVTKHIKELATNTLNLATSQHEQTLSLQKRCQALITVIYTIIAQQDSKINVNISRAAKKDSTSMTSIAILGIVFLPAMLIAVLPAFLSNSTFSAYSSQSIFSMSMFNFSTNLNPNASPTSPTTLSSTSYVTSKFWIYWAVTIPLTLLILSIWYLWMRVKAGFQNPQVRDEFLKRDRMMIFRNIHDASNSVVTPFYPSKEAQVSSSRLCNVGERGSSPESSFFSSA